MKRDASRAVGAGLWLTAALIALLATVSLLLATWYAPYDIWDDGRLAVSALLFRGGSVYPTPAGDALMTTMYPPVWALSYVAATWASSPTAVFVAGRLLTGLFVFVPVLVLLWTRAASKPMALISFGLFVFAAARLPSLAYSGFRPHADAPSLGLALIACVFALSWQRRRFDGWVMPVLVTLAAWLAVGAKQTMFPLAAAIPVWVLVVGGARPLLRMVAAGAATGSLVLAGAVALFPADALYLNLVTIPSRFPLLGRFPLNLARVAHELLETGWPLLVMVAAAAAIRLSLRWDDWREWLRSSAWPLMLVVASFNLPMSFLARIKLGGWPNNLSPFVYFLLAGVCLMLVEPARLEALKSSAMAERLRITARGFAATAGVILSAFWVLDLATFVNDESRPLNPSQLAFEYLEAGGDAYFPSRPLAHIMAGGRAFHFAPTVYDWEVIAGLPMGDEQRQRYFPESPAQVCWERNVWGGPYVLEEYFPTYVNSVTIDELPTFTCFAEPDRADRMSSTSAEDNGKL